MTEFKVGDRVRYKDGGPYGDARGREGTVTDPSACEGSCVEVKFEPLEPLHYNRTTLVPVTWVVPLTPEEEGVRSTIEPTAESDPAGSVRREPELLPAFERAVAQQETTKRTTIYLAGPMTGYPEFNFPAFHAAAEELRDVGLFVFNPAESFDGDTTLAYEAYMRHDLDFVVNRATEVYVLPGWQASSGARLEVTVARALGKRVVDFESRAEVEATDLPVEQEAATHVYGARQASYGHPATDFERTGRIWGAILGIDPIPAPLVALCMAGLKISREVNQPKRDNMVDLIGYAICESRIVGHQPDPAVNGE